MGNESGWLYAGYNNPADPRYPARQQFGYNHDLQATDAELQNGWFYGLANAQSAAVGMTVLTLTGDVNAALDAARSEWAGYGFQVQRRYGDGQAPPPAQPAPRAPTFDEVIRSMQGND